MCRPGLLLFLLLFLSRRPVIDDQHLVRFAAFVLRLIIGIAVIIIQVDDAVASFIFLRPVHQDGIGLSLALHHIGKSETDPPPVGPVQKFQQIPLVLFSPAGSFIVSRAGDQIGRIRINKAVRFQFFQRKIPEVQISKRIIHVVDPADKL